MSNRFPLEFFEELVKKQMIRDVAELAEVTLVDDDDATEDWGSLEDTIPERVVTIKF